METLTAPTVIRRPKKTEPKTQEVEVEVETEADKAGYLCISRKCKTDQDTILIGGNIEIKVISIRGNSVRLGIRASDKVPVDRAECAGRYQKT